MYYLDATLQYNLGSMSLPAGEQSSPCARLDHRCRLHRSPRVIKGHRVGGHQRWRRFTKQHRDDIVGADVLRKPLETAHLLAACLPVEATASGPG